MPSSTLDPDNFPEPSHQPGRPHGVNALGPSDLSDSGSDIQGGFKPIDQPEFDLGLDRGTNDDPDSHILSVSSDTDESIGDGSVAWHNGDLDFGSDIDIDRIDEISDRPPEELD